MRYFYIGELIREGNVSLLSIPAEGQRADLGLTCFKQKWYRFLIEGRDIKRFINFEVSGDNTKKLLARGNAHCLSPASTGN